MTTGPRRCLWMRSVHEHVSAMSPNPYPQGSPGRIIKDSLTSRDIHHYVRFGIFENHHPGTGFTYEWSLEDLSDMRMAQAIRQVAFGSERGSGQWWSLAKDMLDVWRSHGRPRFNYLCHTQDGAAWMEQAQLLERLGSGQGVIAIPLEGAP